MCVLCDHSSLELLVAPIEELPPGQLAAAIRAAREAAEVGVLDHVEAVLRGEAPAEADPTLYGEVVVARAREAGLLDGAGALAWERRLQQGDAGADPRVQGFLSSAAETIDDYRALLAERRQVVARFVEVPEHALEVGWIDKDGELWFEYRDEAYTAIPHREAMEIVERELAGSLHTLRPDELLRYTELPDAALEGLAAIQARGPEAGNDILAELVDLHALAEDRVRAEGYAPFFQGEEDEDPVGATPFGDWLILHVPAHD